MVDTSVHSSETVTNGIRVTVRSQFLHAEPQRPLWYFTYTVRIVNEGTETVKLVSRHWIITNGSNQVEEVKPMHTRRQFNLEPLAVPEFDPEFRRLFWIRRRPRSRYPSLSSLAW